MAHDELIARRLRAADVEQEDAVLAGRLQTEERREAARERREGDAQHIRQLLYERAPGQSYTEAARPAASR